MILSEKKSVYLPKEQYGTFSLGKIRKYMENPKQTVTAKHGPSSMNMVPKKSREKTFSKVLEMSE